MKKVCGIYCIENQINHKKYIGQSIDIHRRWNEHQRRYKVENDELYNKPLYRAMRKYGVDCFIFTVLESCSKELLNERETYYIRIYNTSSKEHGYNLNDGGAQPVNYKKLTHELLKEIKMILKTQLTPTADIAKKFNVSARFISGINTGEYFFDEEEDYPQRSYVRSKNNVISKIHSVNQQVKKCPVCGKTIKKQSITCNRCSPRTRLRKCTRPAPVELAEMIVSNGFVGVGKQFGLTDNAVRKWCIDYKMPTTKKELSVWLCQNR